jgi:hypothetical protein
MLCIKFESRSQAKRWLLTAFILIVIGCASTPSTVNQNLTEPLFENAESISVAVLPFVDKTGADGIAKLLRNAFYRHLSVRRYRDIELYVIDGILAEHNLTDPTVLLKMHVTELGRLLDCDAVVLGEVTAYEKVFLGIYSQMAVGAAISIWDSRSGQMVWFDRHVTRTHEGGVPFSFFEVPFISLRSGWNLREKVKMRTVDELSRYLTGRIPYPAGDRYTGKISESLSN